jgi:hypothetical protein
MTVQHVNNGAELESGHMNIHENNHHEWPSTSERQRWTQNDWRNQFLKTDWSQFYIIYCTGVVHQNCKQHCPSRTGIPQSACTLGAHTKMLDSRSTESDILRLLMHIFHNLQKMEKTSWNPYWQVTEMDAPLHSSNMTIWNAVDMPNFSSSLNLPKLWHLHLGKWKESPVKKMSYI